MWTNVAIILQITHSAALCVLGVIQVMRQSLQLYRATKQWQLNRYMSLLARQGILSFFAYVPVSSFSLPRKHRLPTELTVTVRHRVFLFNLINVLSVGGTTPTGWQGIPLVILEYVPIYTLTPRFILWMRGLYARDARGRREGGIDTGFGLSSSGTTAMVFAGAGQNQSLEDIEDIPMEVGTAR